VLIYSGPRAQGAIIKGLIPKYDRRVSDILKFNQERLGRRTRRKPAGQPSLIDGPDNLQGVKERVAA
jgi:hypothetical protein